MTQANDANYNGLTLALSKGRILKDTLPLLKKAGIELLEDPEESRKLIFPTTHADVRILILRASDVPTYVEHGAADFGVAGKDVLMEHGSSNLYELLDLQIAKCRLMTAGKVGLQLPSRRLRIATHYVKVTRAFFASRGERILMEIFDIRGRKVRTLLNSSGEGIAQKVTWNGTDDHGNLLPGGIYLCRVTSGEKTITCRMVLIR